MNNQVTEEKQPQLERELEENSNPVLFLYLNSGAVYS